MAALQVDEFAGLYAWEAKIERDQATTIFMTKAITTFPNLYKVSVPDTCALPNPARLPNVRELAAGEACRRLSLYLPTLTKLQIDDPGTLSSFLTATKAHAHALTHFHTKAELNPDLLKGLLRVAPSIKHLSVEALNMPVEGAWNDLPSWKLETLRVTKGVFNPYTLRALPYNVTTDDQGRPRPVEIYGPTSEKCVRLSASHLEVSCMHTVSQ